ncbi:nickel pincer cofactor biosynthesis protein LarC [Natranaerobius trueperi]|uniref:Pyridinium-3,5-bisthiocarboxylic acid mononucleotide nickel insertion protein n=1 Tax=Natranaerobius trueperi TaxID=759412 RepID=A0A226C2F2_9FIRM|nr:nickel pincer cofactor biosynthesis protein LarC [Natranaerobius trueperi]OWZ84587.1 TIGR00299 family protein [Natranaerobius trueperi]
MTKILYLDCFSGISGDMFLGLLSDLGVSLSEIEDELKSLPLPNFSLKEERIQYNGITSTNLKVEVPEEHHHRNLDDILEMVENSSFNERIKNNTRIIFEKLASAEAKIHGTTPNKVHFHEVGGLDSIIDIVGSVIGLFKLDVDQIYASPIHVGTGFINCQHGKIPVPAPATLELLKEENVPIYSEGVSAELCTPTGASLLISYVNDYGPLPSMHVSKIGYGAGKKKLTHPNLLRGVLGLKSLHTPSKTDKVHLLQANIDDMNPELFSDVMEKSFELGAYDVFFSSIQMKKQRPGVTIEILSPPNKVNQLRELLLRHTTTFGVRSCLMDRVKLTKKQTTIETPLGPADIKLGIKDNQTYSWSVEYESAKTLAKENSLPLKEVYQIIMKSYVS